MRKALGLFLAGLILFSAVALAVSNGISLVAAADTGKTERITLSPAVAKPSLKAGQIGVGKLKVINDGDTDYDFVLYARPYSVTGEKYDPNFTEVNDRTEAYQWVQFDKTEYHLKAGDHVEVGYHIRVPANAAGGGHYAVLFAETQPAPGETDSVVRKKRVGTLLYMTVAGSIRQSGSLASWEAPAWQKTRPLTSTVRVKNDGNVHFQANLAVNYNNLFGKTLFKHNQEMLVLPGTTRRIPIDWQKAPAVGIFKVSGQVKFLDKTEKLPVKYVILLPVSYLIITAGIIAAAVIFIILLNRRRRAYRREEK